MTAISIPDRVFYEAVQEFWRVREEQAARQLQRGTPDQGYRGAVTGGKQMHGFARKIEELLIGAGVSKDDIFYGLKPTTLPGFYRPTKEWDIIVVSKGRLIAAIELKSQVGPSFGNNFNNRVEEAVGTAVDLWTAHRESAFSVLSNPWLGYFFVLEDCTRSRSVVRIEEPHFEVLSEFKETSYAKRYEIFCRKLVKERQYSAACLLLVDRSKAHERANYDEPAEDLSARRFLAQLLGHVLGQLSS
ncbi:PaeR7I family type II restriction endonuclease [Thermomicrobiaceae bacterium CFH 74404]|uniref:PaeR7I family type II restriction endonuclease n=1 Tax=Thermalbibacter longus TaxID=2951981 RepID=A0AA42BB39_9BACT|nr:PaeR7I family type II restriction endonuclease [Thermalbibacter longus]MCM8750482.1 PaeR7I family type II restriction endonuclease [Thermalbibacter longus]